MFSAFNLSEDELSVGANVVAPCVPVTGIGGEEVICYFAYDETGSPIKTNATAVEIIRNINTVATDPLQLDEATRALAASGIIAKNGETSSSRFLDKEQTISKIVVGKNEGETQTSSEKIGHKDSDSQERNADTSNKKISENIEGNGEVPIGENNEVTIDCDDCEEFVEISSAKDLVDASDGKGRWSNKKRIGRKASNILTVDEAGAVPHNLFEEASTSDAILHHDDISYMLTHDEGITVQNDTLKRKLESSDDVESPEKKPCTFYLERRHLPKGIGSGKGSAIKRMMSTKRPSKARGHKKKKKSSKSSKSKVLKSGVDEEEENGDIENRTAKEILTPKWRVVPMSPFKRNNEDGTVEQVAVISEPGLDKEQDSALNDNEAAEVLIQIGQMAVCTGNNALACMDCGEQCKTKRDLKRHMLLHTGERVLECSQCNYKTNRTNRMKAHIKTHTGEKNYFCSKCDFACIQKPNYDKHVYDFHNKKVSCNECNFSCIGRQSLNEHKKIHLANKKYACGECDYRTNDSTALKSHLTKHTKVKPVKCPQCDQRFRDNYGLKIHSLIHSGEKPYTCFKCNYQTVSQEFLDKHLNDYHTAPTKKVSNYKIDRTCKYCGYTCKGEETFAKHQLYHEQNGPMMKCDQCDYQCRKFSTMREHLHRHKGKVLRCELCPYRFINPQMYDAHMISHAQNEIMNFKQYLNNSPNKSGSKESPVKSPSKSDRQEKPLSKRKQKEEKMRAKKDEGTVMKRKRTVLKESNKDTSDEKLDYIKELGELFSNPIEEEEKSESNENSNVYFCGSCSFSSRTKKELNAHIPIHSFNKQFTCLECGFCCDQHLELVTHIQSHAFSKRQIKRIEFECSSCKLKFSSKNSLDNHKIEHHASKNNALLLEQSSINNSLPEVNEILFSQGIEYECPKCDYKHELQSKIKEHIIDYHHVELGPSNGVLDTSQDKINAHEDSINIEEHKKTDKYQNMSSENKNKLCESNDNESINNGNHNEDEDISNMNENDISPSSPYSHNSDPPADYNDDDDNDVCSLNNPDEFECPMCDFKTSTKEGMKDHMISVHQNISPGSNIIELPNEDEMSSSEMSPQLENEESRCDTDGYVSEPEDAFTLVLDDSEGSDDEYNDSCATIIKSETEKLDENYIQDDNDSTSDVEFIEEIVKKNNDNILEEELSNESDSQIEIYTSQDSNDGLESSNDQSQGSSNNISFASSMEQSSSNLQKAELMTSADEILSNKKIKSDMKGKNILKNYIGVKTIDGDWKCIDCEKIYTSYQSLRAHKKKKCNEKMKNKILSNKKTNEIKRQENISNLKKAAQKNYLLEENISWAQNENGIYMCLECNDEHKSYKFLVYHLLRCKNPDLISEEKLKLIEPYRTKDGQFKCSNCECIFKHRWSILAHKEKCLLSCRCAPVPIDDRNKTKDGKWKCFTCSCLFLNFRSIRTHKKTCMVSCACVWAVDRQRYDCPYCNCSYLRESTLLYKHIKSKECMKTCNCVKTSKDKNILKLLQNDINDHNDTNTTKEIPGDNVCENTSENNFEDSLNSTSHIHNDTSRVEIENIEDLENQDINEVSARNINNIENITQEDENDNLQKENKYSIISGKDPIKYPFECKHCTQRFNRKSSLTLHMKSHENTSVFKCENCKASFKKSVSLKKHTLRCSKNKYKCEKCPFRCKNEASLKKHSTKHIKEYPCPNCTKTFKTAKMLEFHMDLHNPEKLYECNLCNYKCKRPEYLKNHHSSKHTKKKKFACNQCEYSCHYACNLRKHLMIHDPSQQVEYECPRCDYKNKLKNRIKEHIMKVHEGIQIEKRHQCPLCPFKGRDPYVLRKHILVHTGEKPYECGECDFKCSTKVQLRRHIRIHTGETFNCTLCDFQTVDKASLQTHYITHTGVKRYVCDECDYKCNTIHRLKLHKQTHSKEKLFQCGECFKRLKDRASLMRHLTSKHIE